MERRTIRRFDDRQLDEETLQLILQAGLYAPSAGGRQGVPAWLSAFGGRAPAVKTAQK